MMPKGIDASDAARQYRVQKSIRNAAWSAFGAACIYAFISWLQWGQMIKQSKTANASLRQSTESFRIDERAWMEIKSIGLRAVTPQSPGMRTGFIYDVFPENVGKTVARYIVLRRVTVVDGNQGSANARAIEMTRISSSRTNQARQLRFRHCLSPIRSLQILQHSHRSHSGEVLRRMDSLTTSLDALITMTPLGLPTGRNFASSFQMPTASLKSAKPAMMRTATQRCRQIRTPLAS